MLKSSLITRYRGTRYHLKEYSGRAPENPQELFNLRHASLRNVIERTFGVLKKRFPIIASGTEARYHVDTTSEIVLACYILHNFLMTHFSDDQPLDDAELEGTLGDAQSAQSSRRYERRERIDDESRRGAEFRNTVAASMWTDYIS